MAKDRITIPNGYVSTTLGILLSAAIAFNVWAVKSVHARPTEERVKEMIVDKSEAPVIYQMLKSIKEDIAELKALIRKP